MNPARATTLALTALLSSAAAAQDPSFENHGDGCPGPKGIPRLQTLFGSTPEIGADFEVALTYPGADVGVMFLGRTDEFLGGSVPLPLDLAGLGMPGCFLRTDTLRADPVSFRFNIGTWEVPIPFDPTLLGLTFFMQGAVVDPDASGLPVRLSNSQRGVIGQFTDLVITSGTLGINPTVVPAGGDLQFSAWTVQNTGLVSTPAFTNNYYISSDPTVTPADVLLRAAPHPGLAPGQTLSMASRTLSIPETLVPGTYWVGVIADAGDDITESDESNNARSTQVTVTAPLLPDLRIIGNAPTLTPNTLLLTPLGDPILEATAPILRNDGPGTATNVTVCLLATESFFGTGMITLETRFAGTIAPGQSFQLGSVWSVPFPNSTPTGEYLIGYWIDCAEQIEEGNEFNNLGPQSVLQVNNPF